MIVIITFVSLLLYSWTCAAYVSNVNAFSFRPPYIKNAKTEFSLEISRRNIIYVKDHRVFKAFAAAFISFVITIISKDNLILVPPSAVIHYGTYCGPGPDRSVNTEPVDGFDSICKDHDIDYSLCQPEILHFQVNSINVYENSFPTFINQLISIRGKLPPSIIHKITSTYPAYTQCIHRADAKFVHKLRALKVNDVLNSRDGISIKESEALKAKPTTASAAGAVGNICLLGFKYGQDSDCLISSYSLFTTVALDLFSSDLEADAQNLNL